MGMADGRVCVFDNRDTLRTDHGPSLLGTLSATCGTSPTSMCAVGDTLVVGYESGDMVVWDCSAEAVLGVMVWLRCVKRIYDTF